MKVFAVKLDHEYEEKNFMVTLFKIVENHNSLHCIQTSGNNIDCIIDHGNVCDASKTALIGPTKRGPF